MTDIFLSYSSTDRERVRPIRDALAAAGYDVFWDQETPPGENWNRWILGRLVSARLVLVLWSRTSAASDNVIHEATIAREALKLVPAMLEPLTASDFPMGFYTVQAVSLSGWNASPSHAGYASLIRTIRSRLGNDTTPDTDVAAPPASAQPASQPDVPVSEERKQIEEARLQAAMRWSEQQNAAREADREAKRNADLAAQAMKKAQLKAEEEAERLAHELRAATVIELNSRAENGDAAARAELEFRRAGGEGISERDADVARTYHQAMNEHSVSAQVKLAEMLRWGWGITRNKEEGARLLKIAAAQGYPPGQSSLAFLYFHGDGVEENHEEALRLFTLAADQGDPQGQFGLGAMHEQGMGVRKSYREAVKFYRLAADQSYAPAYYSLAELYLDGRGVLKSEKEALRLFGIAEKLNKGSR